MKKNNSYMTRALQARDPRFADVLGKLGYSSPSPNSDDDEPREEPTAATKPKSKRRRRKKAAN